MKKHLVILFLLVQIFQLDLIGQNSIMTYNIRLDLAQDNENRWDNRKEELVEMIAFYSPDIFGIQEGLDYQVRYLDSLMVNYCYVGLGRDDGKSKEEYMAIFYNKNKFNLLTTKTYWLSETPEVVSMGWDAACNRTLTYALFEDIRSKNTINVVNCHFDHMGEESRKNSANLILELFDVNDKKFFVMGDFNSEPEMEPIKILKSKLKDAQEISQSKPYGPVGTFNGFNTEIPIERRIDYIFTNNIRVLEFAHIDDRRKNNLYPSDHIPVYVKFE